MMMYDNDLQCNITCYFLTGIGCSKPKAALLCALVSTLIFVIFLTKGNDGIGDKILNGAQSVKQYSWTISESSERNILITQNKEMIVGHVGAARPLDIDHKLIPSQLDGKGTTKRLPHCIMVGVSKAGTFTLIHFLGFHPAIVIPEEEINFFHIEDNYSRGYKWYLNKLPLSRPGQVTMEKSPRYFYYDHVPKRIKDMRKDVKLLVVLRDPIDRAISCHVQRVHQLQHDGLDYNVTLEDVFIKSSTGEINSTAHCINTTLYSVHLKRWLQAFPLEQFHFVDGDNLIVNPYSEIHAIEPYMNVKTWFEPAMFQFSEAKGFYCVVKPGEQRQYCMPESKGRPHPDIPHHLHEKMLNFFQPYNVELAKMLGRKFSWFDKYEVS